jgi:hypothetical protein
MSEILAAHAQKLRDRLAADRQRQSTASAVAIGGWVALLVALVNFDNSLARGAGIIGLVGAFWGTLTYFDMRRAIAETERRLREQPPAQ